MEINNILMIFSFWDEQKGPQVFDCNQEITHDINTISIQCFMSCFHLFSTGLAKQSKKPPMKLTLPLPNYGKIARIYFGSWEDIEVRGKFRAFGVFFVLDNVGTLEELLFDSIIGKLNLSDNPFQEDLIQTLENSINRQLRPAFDAETAIQSIKSRLITVQNLTRIYKTQELRLMAKSLGIPLTRKSKKILAKDILILLIKDERD
ncbi:MAG: hypothetical protein JSW11_01055 [Candidatus Heimdallarchaeota archaeon]|nr:MAG: hypothetical protein JSW11_01055 [Candidatus Heimdallarchaeota archaeon]